MSNRSRQQSPSERVLMRLYELSLRTLPCKLRRQWAAEMTALFAERLRDASDHGGAAATLATGGRELGSIAIAAFRSRVGQASGRVHRAHDAQDGSDVWRTDPMPALLSYREDRRPLKLATMGALACHFALFLVVLPRPATPEPTAPPEEEVVVIIAAPRPPPPAAENPLPVRKDAPPMPIIDPTPRDPEPLLDREAEYRAVAPSAPVSVSFEVGPPARPPEELRERVRAGVDVQLPRLLARVEPEYPEMAVRARHECVVVLEAVIGKAGEVIDARVLRGCRLGLDESALASVQQWQFTAPTLNGRPVEVVANFTVRFRLR